MMEHLEHRVLLAGVPEAWPMERVLAAKLILGAGAALVGILMFVKEPGVGRLLMALAGTALAWFIPDLLLYNSATKRQLEIRNALPDLLDQMTIAVEAGLAFDGAMTRAARSGEGPLNDELLRTMQDVQAGLSRNEALKGLSDRTKVEELRHFVSAVIQADKFGVPVARVLRVQAAELRIMRRQRAEEKAMKLPVKIIFPLVFFILPVVFVVLLGPAAIRISQSGIGG
jgi:tight adherence protein C